MRSAELVERLDVIRSRFADFATEYADLPVYAAVTRAVSEDAEAAALLLDAAPGQARPVLWLAALHDLVLRRPDVPAARWYASVVGPEGVPQGDPWPDVRETVLGHAPELRETIRTRVTQTNEVGRAAYVAPALALAAADVADRPVHLLELGSSAGLLLGVDRYRVELTAPTGSLVLGDPGSPVRCVAEDRSPVPLGRRAGLTLPRVTARVGLDRHPVDLSDAEEVRWLEACLWPEVPGRVERFRAARDLLREDPPRVVAGDMATDVGAAAASLPTSDTSGSNAADAHLVVLSSWALTYVPRPQRSRVVEAVAALARGGRPVTWLSAEAAGCVPGLPPVPEELLASGGTVLATRSWREGRESAARVLGTCHPHGAWVRFV